MLWRSRAAQRGERGRKRRQLTMQRISVRSLHFFFAQDRRCQLGSCGHTLAARPGDAHGDQHPPLAGTCAQPIGAGEALLPIAASPEPATVAAASAEPLGFDPSLIPKLQVQPRHTDGASTAATHENLPCDEKHLQLPCTLTQLQKATK